MLLCKRCRGELGVPELSARSFGPMNPVRKDGHKERDHAAIEENLRETAETRGHFDEKAECSKKSPKQEIPNRPLNHEKYRFLFG